MEGELSDGDSRAPIPEHAHSGRAGPYQMVAKQPVWR